MTALEPEQMVKARDTQSSCRHRLSRRFILISALLALTFCVVAAGFAIRSWLYSPIAFIDGVDGKDIKQIHVQFSQYGSKDITSFGVKDRATITQILDTMKPVSFDWFPAQWEKYAYFLVEFTDGTMLPVAVYETHEEAAAFSIDRKYYRGGSERKLQDILISEGKRIGVVTPRVSKKKS